MAKTNKLASLIKELVKQEVKKQVTEIFIKEGIRSMTENASKNNVLEVLPKRKPQPAKKVTYTKNPVLNDILNETANPTEMEEYPTMGGGTFDTTKMAQAMGYGSMLGDAESRRKAAAIQTAQAAGADTNNEAVQNVMSDLTKDYRGVMKALDKKDGKI
jgi:hypothetical protein|tara:strand:- start:3620 stop:4096 length:477 start_codon:yes stop_codon:yes gene_type:complete